MHFPVSRQEKEARVVVVIVRACTPETVEMLKELSKQPGDAFTFPSESARSKGAPVALIKMYSPANIPFLLDLSELDGNSFEFPHTVRTRNPKGIIIGSPPPMEEEVAAPNQSSRHNRVRPSMIGGSQRRVRREVRTQFPAIAH